LHKAFQHIFQVQTFYHKLIKSIPFTYASWWMSSLLLKSVCPLHVRAPARLYCRCKSEQPGQVKMHSSTRSKMCLPLRQTIPYKILQCQAAHVQYSQTIKDLHNGTCITGWLTWGKIQRAHLDFPKLYHEVCAAILKSTLKESALQGMSFNNSPPPLARTSNAVAPISIKKGSFVHLNGAFVRASRQLAESRS